MNLMARFIDRILVALRIRKPKPAPEPMRVLKVEHSGEKLVRTISGPLHVNYGQMFRTDSPSNDLATTLLIAQWSSPDTGSNDCRRGDEPTQTTGAPESCGPSPGVDWGSSSSSSSYESCSSGSDSSYSDSSSSSSCSSDY